MLKKLDASVPPLHLGIAQMPYEGKQAARFYWDQYVKADCCTETEFLRKILCVKGKCEGLEAWYEIRKKQQLSCKDFVGPKVALRFVIY